MTNENEQAVKLTSYSKGAGCGCKISPAVLKDILKSNDDLPADPRLIVGNDKNDDASVIDLGNGLCLVSTTDFFMPVVDDAFEFGKISATNALSDIYAMGGKPLTALAILGWPVDKLPSSVAARVLDGARFMCRMAGITLAGGHSIESAEPFFGLAVNGTIIKDHIKTNSGSQEGDLLFLTKPLGMGIITTAAKRGVVNKQDLDECVSYMSTLNKVGEELAKISGVRAMTDITGFGLAGHLIEMCEGSGLSAKINFENIPVFPCIGNYISQFIYPDMTMKNFSFFSSKMSELNSSQLLTLCDPQTSGGLLVSVSPQFVDEYLEIIRRHNLFEIAGRPIGTMVSREDKLVFLD